MDTLRAATLALCCLLVATAGCAWPTTGDRAKSPASPTTTLAPPSSPPSPTTKGAPELPPNVVQFGRSAGSGPAVNGTGFHYSGTVVVTLEDADRRFENVTLCLYDRRWNVVASRDLGTVGPNTTRVPVDVHVPTPPKRLVVEHPAFDDSQVYGDVLVRRDGTYEIAYRTEMDAPPLPASGGCR